MSILKKQNRLFKKSTVFDCQLFDLLKADSSLDGIIVAKNAINIPFDVNRVYYLYDIPEGESRGGHAHYELEQYIIAAKGSFDVILDDGTNTKLVSLNHPKIALNIIPGLWRSIENFSSGSICLVLASNKYLEADYIRDYKKFLDLKL